VVLTGGMKPLRGSFFSEYPASLGFRILPIIRYFLISLAVD
jgi:hypothetical protein